MNTRSVSIIMRSKNEQPYTKSALDSLYSQTFTDFTLHNIDSGSDDGTLEVVKEFNNDVISIAPSDYVPGKVLNDMVSRTNDEIIVFLNADAIPQDTEWLAKLLKPIFDGDADSTISRQISRDDAHYIVKFDYERGYNKEDKSSAHEMFSAVACAFKREMWESVPFYTDGYAEDLVWAIQCQRLGYRFKYVSDSVVEHSHNYSLKSLFRKKFRHGLVYYRLSGLKPSILKQSYKMFRELTRDLLRAFKDLKLLTIPYNFVYRVIIHWAIYRGERKAYIKMESRL